MNKFVTMAAAAAFSLSGGIAYAQSEAVAAVAAACAQGGDACALAVQAAIDAAIASAPPGTTFDAGAFLAELAEVAQANPELQGAMANAVTAALDAPAVADNITPDQQQVAEQVAEALSAGEGVPEEVVAEFSSAG